jgi:hypothetical protein
MAVFKTTSFLVHAVNVAILPVLEGIAGGSTDVNYRHQSLTGMEVACE